MESDRHAGLAAVLQLRRRTTQRVDLDDGSILLPFYFRNKQFERLSLGLATTCHFDGSELKFVSIGNELTISGRWGSMNLHSCAFAKILSHIMSDTPRICGDERRSALRQAHPLESDDEPDLGTYNTQQHWVTHSGGLFLVYTRKDANNDHVLLPGPALMAASPQRNTVI